MRSLLAIAKFLIKNIIYVYIACRLATFVDTLTAETVFTQASSQLECAVPVTYRNAL